jgi:hypothetical protein
LKKIESSRAKSVEREVIASFEAIFEFKGVIQREVNNLNDEQIKITKLLGKECEKYYV